MNRFSIYRVRVHWGRGEMNSDFLVAATSQIVAKRIANKAAPLTASMANISCYPIGGCIPSPEILKPQVITRL